MNKGVSIVGFKKSGKTTLMLELAREFKKRGSKLSAAKFSHHGFDRQNTDTDLLAGQAVDLAGLSEEQTIFFWQNRKYLPDLLPLMKGDLLLVEGGKKLGWLPRILVLKHPREAEELDYGLAMATWGDIKTAYLPHINRIEELADLIQEKGFILPGLDCGSCGHETCRDLGKRILAGQAGQEDCLAVNSECEIRVNGQIVGMNPFVERIFKKTLQAMLSELKGYSPGRVEIKINL
ncbi:molybdopterin-guanine dinucleotide biosynthesis protein MobB [Desulfonatronovibrio hydrogenovorans]|uniref:molybdopterin-guanine dinucleotide biosynthesis protein MobB n=1 Tax=Desulfonatronovibrio hydrogenovorans TaxID=53245 RepID=UPI00048C1820|nr:molybdopterin-guanine dinucleotide biosynthesis protein MobB [Desulfonatronovibrio hydrogenovorans]